ncbi:MAG: hypothetical protein LAT76_03715 [Schleiferiaceae bacterium]|nr:hypothetical protein [Schleiferiaceae bacterium]
MFSKLFSRWRRMPFLGKMVFYFVGALLALAFLFPPKATPVNYEVVSFFATQPDQIYFKNVRSYYYRLKEDKDAGFLLYRHKGFNHLSFYEDPLRLMIVHNWRIDEAYVFFETEEVDIDHGIIITLNNKEQYFTLKKLNNEGHFKVAAACYNALLQGATFQYQSEIFAAPVPLFQNQRQQRALRATLEDYFRLVGKA